MREFIMRNIYLILMVVMVVMLAIVGGGWLYSYNRCEEPSAKEVEISAFLCVMDFGSNPNIREDFCVHLGREADCELSVENDEKKFEEYISNHVSSCMKESLSQHNKCVDGVDSFVESLRR